MIQCYLVGVNEVELCMIVFILIIRLENRDWCSEIDVDDILMRMMMSDNQNVEVVVGVRDICIR